MADNTISLFKLRNKLDAFKLDRFTYSLTDNNSLKLIKTPDPKYVDPIFSIQSSSIEGSSFDDATIILISAAGATGKTALTENLSSTLGIPIFDLSEHDPVASNSLTGLLYNSMDLADFSAYSQKLQQGKAAMIIDALDEGYMKTTVDGFYSFLDNIVKIASQAQGTPFILLGRTNIVEIATIYLEEQGLKTALLQIEPFTIDAAKKFIDKQVESKVQERFADQYKAVRDYIVDAIGGFFKNQSEINRKQYLQFIGYAPVLLAISTLLNKNSNYHALLDDLKASNQQNVKLIISILEEILRRDKEDKIDKLLLPHLLTNRDDAFKKKAYDNAYTPEEQCIRLLWKQLHVKEDISITDDAYFDNEYNKEISSWLDEHPFLSNGKIQNVVFESYIISKLIKNPKYKDYVFQYLTGYTSNAYILFYIYNELANQDRVVDKEFIPYLFESLKALDKKGHYSSMEFTAQRVDETTHDITCELNFFRPDSDSEDYSYITYAKCSDELYIGSEISNVIVDVPLTISLSSEKIEFTPPAYIRCDTIKCTPTEILLNAGGQNESIVLECNNFNVSCNKKGILPSLTNKGRIDKQFQLICKNQLSFPFVQYQSHISQEGIPSDIIDKYQKMRRLFLMFRSHSKGDLARYKEKIDNRIGNSSIGKKVLDALIDKGVLYSKGILYFINLEKMAQELGVKYDDIRSSIINDKIRLFLSKI